MPVRLPMVRLPTWKVTASGRAVEDAGVDVCGVDIHLLGEREDDSEDDDLGFCTQHHLLVHADLQEVSRVVDGRSLVQHDVDGNDNRERQRCQEGGERDGRVHPTDEAGEHRPSDDHGGLTVALRQRRERDHEPGQPRDLRSDSDGTDDELGRVAAEPGRPDRPRKDAQRGQDDPRMLRGVLVEGTSIGVCGSVVQGVEEPGFQEVLEETHRMCSRWKVRQCSCL